jgi:glycosyltransferase involved in cell wall biosynthesis
MIWHKLFRPRVGLIILSNSKTAEIASMTQRAIDSVLLQNRSFIQIVVVESGPDTNYNHADVVNPKVTFNYNQFLKIGIKYLQSTCAFDYYMVMNNDVLAYPMAIDNLVKYGLDSCSPVDPINPEQFGIVKPTFGYDIRYHVVGWAICMRSRLFAKRSLDELFPNEFSFYFQDNYYAHVIKAAGVVHAAVPHSKMVHFEGISHTLKPELLNDDSVTVFLGKRSGMKPSD